MHFEHLKEKRKVKPFVKAATYFTAPSASLSNKEECVIVTSLEKYRNHNRRTHS